MPWTKEAGEQIPTKTTVDAMNLFYAYKIARRDFFPSVTHISYEDDADSGRIDVHMDVKTSDGTALHLRSIKYEDYEDVHTYLNSQPLVRAKYANKKIVDLEATKARVKILADRFDPKVTDGCHMHGGFVVTDDETEVFLGIANSGFSGEKSETEIAYLLRADAWSYAPKSVVAEYTIPEAKRLSRGYKGVGTTVACTLVQYTQELKGKDYQIKGEDITAMRATAMIDNEGSWKALALAGFEPDNLDAKNEWGPEIRYQLKRKI